MQTTLSRMLSGQNTAPFVLALVALIVTFIVGIGTERETRAFWAANEEDAALNQVANRMVEALNWADSKDVTAVMTAKGMAEFCTQQIFIAGQAHAFYQDPTQIPDTSAIVQACSRFGIDANRFAEATAIFDKPNFIDNLKARHNQSRSASGELTKQLSHERLTGLTAVLCEELAKFDLKPTTFVLESIEKNSDFEAIVAVGLKDDRAQPVAETDNPRSSDSKTAALYCRFVKGANGWMFDGFDSEKLLEQQLKLLKSVNLSKVYIPQEIRDTNLLDCTNRWSFDRSRQSDHCIVFWAKEYGHLDPNSHAVPEKFRVDIDDLLAKADKFFETNVVKLKFADTREGKSQLAKYKLQIYVFHTEEWIAAGAGSDDVVGGLWVSPNACQPVGSTIAHEIGHCFQYQVHCDLKGKYGFRYGFGGKGGNGFWEQSAQWQALQDFPNEIFAGPDFVGYQQNFHRHFHHEDQRYSSYFLPFYWQQKHGDDILARIWRSAIEPEDPIQAYMRITGIDFSQFNDEFYDAASRFVTWDIDSLRELGRPYIGAYTHSVERSDNGFTRVSYSRCPGTVGYNVVELSLPATIGPNTPGQVSVKFRGIKNTPHYNPSPAGVQPGWRYGFVALAKDGRRNYGTMHRDASAAIEFQLPKDCERVWFVVTGAPESYRPHAWDEDEKNDEQWPYEVKFTGAEIVNASELKK
jgi:hypothetical protein